MSDLSSGNPPGGSFIKKDDERPAVTSAAPSTPTFGRPAVAPAAPAAPAAPRPSLFPNRGGEGERKPLFPPRAVAPVGDSKPSLFPAREDKGTTLFKPREERDTPLFPRREGEDAAKSMFPRPAAPACPVGDAKPPLFPARDDKGTTLFKSRTPDAPKFGAAPLPSPQGLPPKPTFGSRVAVGVDATPFGSLSTAPKSMYGSPTSPPAQGVSPVVPAPTLSGGLRKEAKLLDEEFLQLRDFLYQQCGIFVAENRKYLVENRLAARLRELGLRTFSEYHNYLRYDVNRGTELNKFFENMTTNETSFFRNGPQLDVFRDKVLIKLLNELRAKGQRKLRIWSAGCSSGEEPYTLAIILHEVLKQEISSWDIKITANDLSLAVLASARRGLYNDYSVRTTPPDILGKYFTKEGNQYRIDPKLQRIVSFGQINLSDKAQLQKVEKSQIVFCRNVIIYFDDEMKRNVINAFYDNLLPGGFLLIGHSESLHNLSRAFKPEHYAGSIVYCKQG